MAQLYICTEAFVSIRRDQEMWVTPGQVAEAGSWPLAVSPSAFALMAIDYPAPGSELQEQKPAQQHPAAENPEPKVEADKSEPKPEGKVVHHRARKAS